MNTLIRKYNSGAALVSVLVILSVISIIVISLLAVSRHEFSVTNYHQRSVQADLAAEYGFRDACQLLTKLAEEGAVITTLASQENSFAGKGDGLQARYTFLSKVEAGTVNHFPLFSGGVVTSDSVANLSVLDVGTGVGSDLLLSSPIKPQVAFDSDANIDTHLSTFGLSYLDESDQVQPETTSPLVGQITLPREAGDRIERRYSFWVEDLEGYPNLDLAGGHRNNNGDIEFSLATHSSKDQRLDQVFTPFPQKPELSMVFESTYHNQNRSGLRTSGLSPQEIFLVPRALAGGGLHPFEDMYKVLADRNASLAAGSHLSLASGVENRVVKGLKPYFTVPRVPYNHGYADEGELKFQLNKFVNEYKDAPDPETHVDELKQYLERNIPEFVDRKGGFPEDYVATLIANMIDYADEDSLPTIRKNMVKPADHSDEIPLSLTRLETKVDGEIDKAQEFDYRGVDSWLPINEFFYRITVDSISNTQAKFTVNLFAEFWNPFSTDVTMEDVTGNFWFVEPFNFLSGIATYNFNTSNYSWKEPGSEQLDLPVLNEPLNVSKTVSVPANSYLVHDFGRIQWSFDLEQPTVIDSIGSPSSSGRKDGKAQMQLMIGGRVVDQSGRPWHVNSATQELVGYDIPRFRDSNSTAYTQLATRFSGLSQGDFMMVYYRPANERQISRFGSFLGDPFMTYYGGGHSQDIVYEKSTPGSRNYYSHANKDLLKAETRVRNWPDRGYDEPHGSQPDDFDGPLPNSAAFPSHISTIPNAAPFRISNRGRFFSLAELGNIHDPVMWMIRPDSLTDSEYAQGSASKQRYENFVHRFVGDQGERTEVDDSGLYFYPDEDNTLYDAVGDDPFYNQMFGGGNTLRIGRKEHPLFDKPGMRASQLLDLLEVGVNGAGLDFANDPNDYSDYNDNVHYAPEAGLDAAEAKLQPYSLVFEDFAHGESIFKRIHGQMNINTAPTAFEIESLLRSPFMLNEIVALPEENSGTLEQYGLLNLRSGSDSGYPTFKNGLNEDDIPIIAKQLMRARPFASKSHLARVLSELIHKYDALPFHHSDQIAEEPVARVLNLTHFTSRHFRIFAQGEVIPVPRDGVIADDAEPIARSIRVYEVFIDQEFDSATGEVVGTTCRVLSSREL